MASTHSTYCVGRLEHSPQPLSFFRLSSFSSCYPCLNAAVHSWAFETWLHCLCSSWWLWIWESAVIMIGCLCCLCVYLLNLPVLRKAKIFCPYPVRKSQHVACSKSCDSCRKIQKVILPVAYGNSIIECWQQNFTPACILLNAKAKQSSGLIFDLVRKRLELHQNSLRFKRVLRHDC